MGFVENINKVAQDLTVDLVAGITAVSANAASINTVAGNIANVNTTAANIAAVSTVATNAADVVTTAAHIANVDTVATHIANVDTTATHITNVDTVATSIASISTVADNIVDVDTVVANIVGINAIASGIVPNIAEILQADTNAATATAQAAIAVNAANTATSILDQFDDRYLGAKSAAPSLDNDGNPLLVGALYFDTVTNRIRVWDGALWSDALTLTAGSVSTLVNKTIDDISNKVGADHIHYQVRNVSGSTIAAGTVVTAQGTQSGTDYVQVVPVTNPQTQIALGIMHTTVANNGTGLCMNTGVSADQVDTSGWAVGTILYPNNTGGLTSTKPTSGRYQACAVVLRSHANQGTLLVEFTEPKYIASTTQAGYVQLNDTLTSTSTVQALTAAQGKVLNDRLVTVENGTVQEGDSVTLTGDVTGTAVFDANGNISITTTVVDDSHNHVISNVDGLQTALDGKQPIDTTLTALAGVTTSADKYIYATAADTFTTGTITSFGRSLVDDVDAATARGTLGISATNTPSTAAGGISATNVQGALQELASDKMSTADYLTAVGTINNPLLYMPLMSDIDLHKGSGTSTFTRASTATYIDRYGVLKSAAIDEPRFEKEGYLNEGGSTNLLTYSERLWDTAYWVVGTTLSSFYTVTNETVLASPYGMADSKVAKFVCASANELFLRKNSLSLSAVNTTSSLFIYVPTQSGITSWAVYNDYNDTETTPNYTSTEFDKWVRISTSKLLTSTRSFIDYNIRTNNATPSVGFTFYAFGAQLEALPFATSYIPTVASAVTRSADILNVTRAGNMPNVEANGEFSLACDFAVLGNAGVNQWVWGMYAAAADSVGLYASPSLYIASVATSAADSNTVTFTGGAITPFINTRSVQVINNSGNTVYRNGALSAFDADINDRITDSCNSIESIRIGSYTPTSITSCFYGHISNFRVYDKTLTAQEVALA